MPGRVSRSDIPRGDEHRAELGVEPICRELPIAPSTFYDHLAQRADAERLSTRAKRDEALRPEIKRVFEENWRVNGVRKVWRQMRGEGLEVARCTVARLMKDMGVQGVIRGKPHRTTLPDKTQPCPLDKVNGQFRVPAPDRLWVSDFTLEWVDRINTRRLLEPIGNIPPAEAEADFYAALETETMAA